MHGHLEVFGVNESKSRVRFRKSNTVGKLCKKLLSVSIFIGHIYDFVTLDFLKWLVKEKWNIKHTKLCTLGPQYMSRGQVTFDKRTLWATPSWEALGGRKLRQWGHNLFIEVLKWKWNDVPMQCIIRVKDLTEASQEVQIKIPGALHSRYRQAN